MKNFKIIAAMLLVLLLGGEWLLQHTNQPLPAVLESTSAGASVAAGVKNPELLRVYQQRLSNVWLGGSGEVIKLLSDDNKGSRHQRFLVQVNSSQTILIAHNIDLAKPVSHVKIGDEIEFHGEYEWNKKGGILHWTHHDPSGKKAGGWIKHKNQLYQ